MSEPGRIPLRNRAGETVAFAIVDATDVAWLSKLRWHLNDKGYAKHSERIGGKSRLTLMHRLILGLVHGDPREGDHVNRDRLDNRRSNLRIVARREGSQNVSGMPGTSSRFRGVSWHRGHGRWKASARVGGVDHHIGYFIDEQDAARAASAFRAKHLPFSTEVPVS